MTDDKNNIKTEKNGLIIITRVGKIKTVYNNFGMIKIIIYIINQALNFIIIKINKNSENKREKIEILTVKLTR